MAFSGAASRRHVSGLMDNWPNPATAALAIVDAIAARANENRVTQV
jgi:hypothetical protein